MSVGDSLLAMIGMRPVSGRDLLVNLVHASILIIPMALILIEVNRP